MKNKETAAILALVLGIFGVHRFYLGQVGLGILYCMLFWFFGLPAILGVIDAIVLFSMSKEEFDRKYNWRYMQSQQEGSIPQGSYYERETRRFRPRRERFREEQRIQVQKTQNTSAQETLKQNGIKKFKDYDFKGAIEDFSKALAINPKDVALHFNISCAYSLMEEVEKGYYHLSKAVEYGFNDYDKIKTHDALAYLRIQPQWDDFAASGYKLVQQINAPDMATQQSGDLLDQLKKLTEAREKGLLTEEEFASQTKKLLG